MICPHFLQLYLVCFLKGVKQSVQNFAPSLDCQRELSIGVKGRVFEEDGVVVGDEGCEECFSLDCCEGEFPIYAPSKLYQARLRLLHAITDYTVRKSVNVLRKEGED